MADKVVTTSELKINAKFVDNDTRMLTIENPVANVDAVAINAVAAVARTTNAILGDKGGANFKEFTTANKIVKTTRYLDLA